LETQEIFALSLIALSLIYLSYSLIKKAKQHNCDKCVINEKPKSKQRA